MTISSKNFRKDKNWHDINWAFHAKVLRDKQIEIQQAYIINEPYGWQKVL
jgi:hypothetical protein